MKPATQVLIERYQKHLYAIAFNICRNQQDAEDVVQDTFIQYHTYKKEFDTEEHIRAWLIRVAINKAKNITRSFWHRNKCNLEEYMETLTFETPESETLFDTVMKYEKDGSVILYYKNQSIDITHKFNKDNICYVKLVDGDDSLYVTVKYNNGYASSPNKYISPWEFN